MEEFDHELLKKLYIPPAGSHKGQNGKLLLIGGSHLFHAASLWSLSIASRIVDMVFYASTTENNDILIRVKEEFRNGIVVPRGKIEDYVNEADCILIGTGMVRTEEVMSHELRIKKKKKNQQDNLTHNSGLIIHNLEEINKLNNEGEQTYWLTKYLLEKYPHKKWVIDAGALQMMEPEWLLQLNGNVVLTPHPKEFEMLFGVKATLDKASEMANKYNCTILLKGEEDIVCSPTGKCNRIGGGNSGMTKGGTGDVLAGLVASLACKNDLLLSAKVGSFLNKKAGEYLFEKMGYYFNASDLVNEIPVVMKKYILD